jgi:hypothetical protein
LFDSKSASRSVKVCSSLARSSRGIQTPSGAWITTCWMPLIVETGDIPLSSAAE